MANGVGPRRWSSPAPWVETSNQLRTTIAANGRRTARPGHQRRVFARIGKSCAAMSTESSPVRRSEFSGHEVGSASFPAGNCPGDPGTRQAGLRYRLRERMDALPSHLLFRLKSPQRQPLAVAGFCLLKLVRGTTRLNSSVAIALAPARCQFGAWAAKPCRRDLATKENSMADRSDSKSGAGIELPISRRSGTIRAADGSWSPTLAQRSCRQHPRPGLSGADGSGQRSACPARPTRHAEEVEHGGPFASQASETTDRVRGARAEIESQRSSAIP